MQLEEFYEPLLYHGRYGSAVQIELSFPLCQLLEIMIDSFVNRYTSLTEARGSLKDSSFICMPRLFRRNTPGSCSDPHYSLFPSSAQTSLVLQKIDVSPCRTELTDQYQMENSSLPTPSSEFPIKDQHEQVHCQSVLEAFLWPEIWKRREPILIFFR